MDDNLTVGNMVLPAQDVFCQISKKQLDELMNSIKNIEKRLESIEKLLIQIQQPSDEDCVM